MSDTNTTAPASSNAQVQAALPAAIQEAIKANPLEFVKAGLQAEVGNIEARARADAAAVATDLKKIEAEISAHKTFSWVIGSIMIALILAGTILLIVK